MKSAVLANEKPRQQQKKTGQEMDPRFWPRKQKSLDQNDLLVWFHTDLKRIRPKLQNFSIGRLMEYLEFMPNRQTSAGNVEHTLPISSK
jgi:hypothetical protein